MATASDGIVLEMTSPAQLRPSPAHGELTLHEVPVSPSAAARIAALYRDVWAPLGGSTRSGWSDAQWEDDLRGTGVRLWFAAVDGSGEDAGMAAIGWSGTGDAALAQFGLRPALQGRGLGGDLLTRVTRLMWSTPAPNGRPTTRVWLWTRPDEHPHALTNYHARGFTRGPDLT